MLRSLFTVSAAQLNRIHNSQRIRCLVWMTAVLGLFSVIATHADAALIAHWKLDENTGQTAADSEGSFDGVLGGAAGVETDDPAWFTPSKIGDAAMDFTASQNDHVLVAHDPGLIEGTQMTASAWIRRGRTGVREMFMAKGNGGSTATTSFWLELDTSNRLVWWLGRDNGDTTHSGGSVTSTATLTDTTDWHQVVASYDGSTKRLYLDGAEIATQSFTMTGLQILNETVHALAIGKLGVSSLPFDGMMDDVGLWTDALTPAEVNATYTLANHSELSYDLGQAQDLFDLHTATSGTVSFGDDIWVYDDALAGLGLNLGEVTKIGDRFFLLLDATTGVASPLVPEPSSLLLLGLGALGMSFRRRRQGRNSQAPHRMSSSKNSETDCLNKFESLSSRGESVMMKYSFVIALVCSLIWTVDAHAVTVNITGDPADGSVFPGGEFGGTGTVSLVGEGGSGDFSGIAVFELPDLGTSSIADANLRFTIDRTTGTMTTNTDIYGLGFVNPVPASLPALWNFKGANDTRTGDTLGTGIGTTPITKIADNFVTAGSVPADDTAIDTDPTSDLTLTGFIKSLYNQGAVAGDFAVFRLNIDGDEASTVRYEYKTSEAGGAFAPLLTLELAPVPEPSSFLLLGLSVLGLVCHTRRRRRRSVRLDCA